MGAQICTLHGISGRLEERQPPRGRARQQAQMREDLDGHRRLFDGGDDLQLATALRAVFKVDIEDAPEQARPAHARRRAVRVFVLRRAGILRCASSAPAVRRAAPVRCDRCTPPLAMMPTHYLHPCRRGR